MVAPANQRPDQRIGLCLNPADRLGLHRVRSTADIVVRRLSVAERFVTVAARPRDLRQVVNPWLRLEPVLV